MSEAPDPGYYFDERAATAAVRFFERLLIHVKGEWAGQPFELLPWQKDHIIRPLFGWKRPDGSRRYRTAYIEVARKNGKSSVAAGIALYLTFADGEPGAEVYSAAADREQAAIVFDMARAMVEGSPMLADLAQVYRRAIVLEQSLSSYKVISADAYTKHGFNSHGVIFDELHTQPNRELWDVLTTSTGARRQPLTFAMSTAGWDRNSICYEIHEYARQISEGVIHDDSFLGYIVGTDPAADWTDPALWVAANPSYGATIKADYLEREATKAANIPAYQNTFRRLHLNQWTSQETRALDMGTWDLCGGALPAEDELTDLRWYGGLDLASTSDLASFVLVAEDEGRYCVRPWFWIPAENLEARARDDKVPYDGWRRDGLLTATEGNVIDYGFIVKAITELGERFNIQEIAFDRWGAFQVSQLLAGAGFEVVAFGQGFASMAWPTKEFLRLVKDAKLRHNNHAVLRWMADNLVVDTDPAGNLKPNKKKSREKIDGITATIMALDRALRHQEPADSVYNERGIRTL